MNCSICHGPINEHKNEATGEAYWTTGHNAQPINDGRCCDTCNETVVLPRRINNAMNGRDPYEGEGLSKRKDPYSRDHVIGAEK
jgi:hypothetical protein|tara:strand:+ start:435 stop:686 length:252 start_codon:yes stop_codon:yes gene_type:complete